MTFILTDNIYVIKTSFYFEIIALVINFIYKLALSFFENT